MSGLKLRSVMLEACDEHGLHHVSARMLQECTVLKNIAEQHTGDEDGGDLHSGTIINVPNSDCVTLDLLSACMDHIHCTANGNCNEKAVAMAHFIDTEILLERGLNEDERLVRCIVVADFLGCQTLSSCFSKHLVSLIRMHNEEEILALNRQSPREEMTRHLPFCGVDTKAAVLRDAYLLLDSV